MKFAKKPAKQKTTPKKSGGGTAVPAQNMTRPAGERCVLCGAETGVLPTQPLSLRPDYVAGCGQLCADCFDKLYKQE